MILFSFLIISSALTTAAQNKVIALDDNTGEVNVTSLPYIADVNCSFNFDSIKNGGQKYITPGVTAVKDNACYWFKFQVVNKSQRPGEWLLDFDKWEYADLYVSADDNTFTEKSTGRLVPLLYRDYPLASHSFIDLKLEGSQTLYCYLRLHTTIKDDVNPADLLFRLVSSRKVQQDETTTIGLLFFFTGIYLIMFLYNLFIYFSIREKGYLYYLGILIFLMLISIENSGYLFPLLKMIRNYPKWSPVLDVINSILFGTIILLFSREFLKLKQNFPRLNKVFNFFIGGLYLLILPLFSGNFVLANSISSLTGLATMVLILTAATQSYRAKYPSSLLFLLAYGAFVIGLMVFLLKDLRLLPTNIFTVHSLEIGSTLEAALFSLALANRINILKKQNEASQLQIIAQLNEYNELQTKLNRELEEKVEARTAELRESQKQLLQKEKLAALGELTAGIAHEIQNPLNFVNNFSEVNADLITELSGEIETGNYDDAKAIAEDIKANILKVIHHGKRADSIVKGMVLHSSAGKGVKEPADINKLADEYLKLSYRGFREKDKSFQATLATTYDEEALPVNVSAGEFGKALLNIYNNAFYALAERKKAEAENYQPVITITTKQNPVALTITIRDNGTGIPANVLHKIYQPFYTNKPTNEGTGLGLSLAYETVKSLGGEIIVNTEYGHFTEFMITLPVS